MKNKLICAALTSSLLLATGTALAGTEGENYFGLQYAYGYYDEDGISETYNPTLLVGRFGRFLTPNLSLEGRLGTGLEDDTYSLPAFGNRDVTLELESLFGLYGAAHFDMTKWFSVYGVLGVSQVKGTASLPSFPGLESTEDNSGFSYGIGADIGIGSRLALNIEYIQYLDMDDFDLGVANVGASFSF
jgi:opacity protein-like surface antigen